LLDTYDHLRIGWRYRFENLAVGTYVVTLNAPGFTKSEVSNINVELNQTVTRNVTLHIGHATTSVQVRESGVARDVGGPIKRNKLFFFVDYEYNPAGQAGSAGLIYAPTQAGYNTIQAGSGIIEFGPNYVFEFRYLGTRGINLPVRAQISDQPMVNASNALPVYWSAPSQATFECTP